MPRSYRHPNDPNKTIKIRGRQVPFLECRRVGQREYFLLRQVGSPFRQRYLAYCRRRGIGGAHFLLQVWRAGPLAKQQLRVLRGLKHDSLLGVEEWQPRGSEIDVVLPWVEGISLEDYLTIIREGRRPPVAPREAVRMIWGLANGVCQLNHDKQIAHGDIQPSNVIVTDHTSRLVLIDFGSAWTLESTAWREEGDGLNGFYAAPELQTKGATPVGFLADQFSVCVLFYELLTLQVPYDSLGGKAGLPGFFDRMKDSLVPPSQASEACRNLPRSLRDGIDRVVKRGLALDPAERYPDRHAWLDDLFEVYASFRQSRELPPVEKALTRVIRWFVKPRGSP
jgi:serine/threonine protein kinase